MMNMDNWPVLSRLKRAVNKARLLFNFRRWRLMLMIADTSGRNWQRRCLSFNNRPGLTGCTDNGRSVSESSGSRQELQRTMSCLLSSEDDIDKRADMFISNFHRQLRMERQISLQLRYCRANSFGPMSS